ncbi:uncharacterized protein LOC120262036, partial [Dioscorea cayenensis subsp. rotundata]|uniref:Uncharacterized protein LOC120262036 n=1 Tax=Dioscorea cayennensis subsp. rotundata TaxID=55577 RepID=A0AB40BFA1_DIOCR
CSLKKKRKIQTIEDLLREQIEKQEFYSGGDAGNNKPPKHGGGGGFGDWYNSKFSEFRDESIQVILATIGFCLSVSLHCSWLRTDVAESGLHQIPLWRTE